MIKEDITSDPVPNQITWRGYTTSNFHNSEDARRAFQLTIKRAESGLIPDGGYIKRALKATDVYLELYTVHANEQRPFDLDEIKYWTVAHLIAKRALAKIGEFMHHISYWGAYNHSLQLLQSNAKLKELGEQYMSGNPFQNFLDGAGDSISTIYEKTLTSTELKKREEVANALERDNPDMPVDKKMAIATATAKKVAEEVENSVDEAAKWRRDDLEGKTWRSKDWDDGEMSPDKIQIDRAGKDVDDNGDELNRRPAAWRGKSDMSKRMTKKGVPTKSEKAFQGHLKTLIKFKKEQGGLTGPKGNLPEEVEQIDEMGSDENNKTTDNDVRRADRNVGAGRNPKDNSHHVYIKGRVWKTFETKSHAENVAKKIPGATVGPNYAKYRNS